MRSRKVYVIVPLCVDSAYVVWCHVSRVVDNLCFQYCTECLFVSHEVTDALADSADLELDIQQEGAARPLSHYHDCLWVHFG